MKLQPYFLPIYLYAFSTNLPGSGSLLLFVVRKASLLVLGTSCVLEHTG